eukprot:5383199-Prymnesium_polylepis.1
MYHHITCPYCDSVFGRVSVQGVSFHKANVCLGHLRCKSACKKAHEALGFDVPELKARSTQDNTEGTPSSPSLAVEQLNETTTLTAQAIRDLQERLACVEAEKEEWKADREAMLAKDAKRDRQMDELARALKVRDNGSDGGSTGEKVVVALGRLVKSMNPEGDLRRYGIDAHVSTPVVPVAEEEAPAKKKKRN